MESNESLSEQANTEISDSIAANDSILTTLTANNNNEVSVSADIFKLIPNGVALDLSSMAHENNATQNSLGVSYNKLVNSLTIEQLNPSFNLLTQPSQPEPVSATTEMLPSLSDYDVSMNFNLQTPPDSSTNNQQQNCFKLLKDLDSGSLQMLKTNLTSLEPGELIGSDQTLKLDDASKQLNLNLLKRNWVMPNNLTYAIIDASGNLSAVKQSAENNNNQKQQILTSLQPLSAANIISLTQKSLEDLQKIQILQQAANATNLTGMLIPQGSSIFLQSLTNDTNLNSLQADSPTYDQPSSTTTEPSQPNQEEINTKEVALKISNELKKYSIPQAVFAQQVLGRSQGTLSDLLRNPKPWSKLKSGRETFRRMWNWLKEPESERMAHLRLCASSINQDSATTEPKQTTSSSTSSSPSPSVQMTITTPSPPKRVRDSSHDSTQDDTTNNNSNNIQTGVQQPNFSSKKPRMVFTEIQRRTLVAIFKEIKRPSKEIQATIAEQLGLKVSTVVNFFMNARRRSVEKYLDDTVVTSAVSTATSLPLTTSSSSSNIHNLSINLNNFTTANNNNNSHNNNNNNNNSLLINSNVVDCSSNSSSTSSSGSSGASGSAVGDMFDGSSSGGGGGGVGGSCVVYGHSQSNNEDVTSSAGDFTAL